MLTLMMVCGGFFLLLGVVYPIFAAICWAVFERKNMSFWKFMRNI